MAVLTKAEFSGINIFGLPVEVDCAAMHEIVESIQTSCLFITDSGEEKVWM